MDICDLHIHSNRSDGLLSPEQIVDWGIRKKLACISLTDHDNVEGIEYALKHASNRNIEVVPGIEISTEHQNAEVHILGYFIDYNSHILNFFIKELQGARFERAKKIVDKLNSAGCRVEFDDVLQTAGDAVSIGRPHIARVMVNMGICSSIQDAFDRYIGHGRPAYVERYKISPFRAVEIVYESGGVSSIAHPGLIPGLNTEKLIKRLKDWGLAGVEVYHTKHNEEDIQKYSTISKRLELVETGGSDCHGAMVDNELLLGSAGVPYKNVMELKQFMIKYQHS